MLELRRETGRRRGRSVPAARADGPDAVTDPREAAGALSFRVLGPVEVLADGAPLTIEDDAQRLVLGSLLVHANRVVPKALLTEEVGAAAPAAVTGLDQMLHAADPAAGGLQQDGGAMLHVGWGQLDELELLRYLEQGRRAGDDGDSAGAARCLEAAWALWRGRPFDGLPERPFLAAHRGRLEQLRLEVGIRLAEAYRALGRAADSLPKLSALLADHGEDETLRVRLAQALQLDGQLEEARRVCRAGLDLLRERGKAAVQLQRLEHDLQLDTPPADVAPVPPVTTRSKMQDRDPLRLPPDTSDLTGREDVVAAALAALEPRRDSLSASRTVLLSANGKAGVGTTALAVHVAHRLRRAYPDGALYVDLRGTRGMAVDPRFAIGNVLLALGLPRKALPEDLESRVELYQEQLATRRALLVLDDAASAEQVAPLLPRSGFAAAIVTSRQELGDVDGTHMTVPPLPPGPALELLTKAAGSKIGKDPALAARVVELCGGVPLALRVAGARAGDRPHWDLARLVADLEEERSRLDVLDVGDLEARAGVALGYDALAAPTATALRLLNALETPDLPIWAAAAAIGTDVSEAEDLVGHLAEARLLEASGRDLDGQLRYRLHAVVRQIIWERGTASEVSETRSAVARVCHTYLRALTHATSAIVPGIRSVLVDATEADFPVPQVERMDTLTRMPVRWFGLERQNIVTLVTQAYDAGLDEMCWLLAAAAETFFRLGAHWTDWRQTHEIALRAARRAGNDLAAANTLRNIGRMYFYSGRWDKAAEPLQAALPVFQAQANDAGTASCLRNLGLVAEDGGRYDEAADLMRRALTLAEHSGPGHGVANTLAALGGVERHRARYNESLEALQAAVAIYRRLGDSTNEHRALLKLALTERELGHDEAAQDLLESCRPVFRKLRTIQALTETLRNLGELYGRDGRHEDALAAFDEAMKLFDAQPDTLSEARVLTGRGNVQWQAGDEAVARSSFRQALALYRQLGSPEGAEVAARLGDPGA